MIGIKNLYHREFTLIRDWLFKAHLSYIARKAIPNWLE